MKRYVVIRDEKWGVVNATHKKGTKIFDNQKDAIMFAMTECGTTGVYVQQEGGHFRKVTLWDVKGYEEGNFDEKKYIKEKLDLHEADGYNKISRKTISIIPRHVKSASSQRLLTTVDSTLTFITLTLTITAIIFTILFIKGGL